MNAARFLAAVVICMELGVLYILGGLLTPYVGGADTPLVLLLMMAYLAGTIKGIVSIVAMLVSGKVPILVRVAFVGSLIPIGTVNVALAYLAVTRAQGETGTTQIAFAAGAMIFAIVAAGCVAVGLSYLIRGRVLGLPAA